MGSSSSSLLDTEIDLKIRAKTVARYAMKCEKDEKTERKKVRKMLEQGDKERARIYAENAIRHRKTANAFVTLSARIEAVAAKIHAAQVTQSVSATLSTSMKKVEQFISKTTDVESMQAVMDHFDEVELQLGVVEKAFGVQQANTQPTVVSSSSNKEEVSDLLSNMQQEITHPTVAMMPSVPTAVPATTVKANSNQADASDVKDDEMALAERLKQLQTV